MAKGHSDHQNHDSGTPTYIIMSVLFAIVIFALEGIKDTINLNSDAQTRSTTLGFIGLGLSICFFWRRLHESLFKSMTAFFFTASLWAYLVATIALPLLTGAEEGLTRMQLIHQCGLGGVVIAGFSLMAALLYHQKPVPALLMTTLAGFLVGFGSLYPLLRGTVGMQHDYAGGENHTAPSAHKKAEIVEEEIHKSSDEHHAAAEEHATAAHAAHDAEPEKGGHHAEEPAPAHKVAAAHAAEDEHEDEDNSRLHKALHKDHEDEEDEAADEHKPRTLTAAQKAKLQRASAKKAVAKHPPAKPKMSLAARAAPPPPPPQGPHWEYAGHEGPEHWGEIADAFKTCSTGLEQSPINIMNTWPTRDAITLDYKPSTFQVLDNGHTIQVNVERGNFATIAGQRYELKQFHFHTPSEHLVENRPYQMEVHFVHANEKGQLAVVGAFINPGKVNGEYQRVWDYIPSKPNEPIKPYNITLDLRRLLPSGLTAFNYPGSLTTPPCSEKVNWNVLYSTLKLSQEQIDRFKGKYQMNARPAQPLNYRKP